MNLPAPPIPPDTDVRDLDGFMLNVERLMASELVAISSHEVIAAALLLWCRAWKQLPAASLPDDERVIAAFARMPAQKFRKLRHEIMRGFFQCSDGRWYHGVLATEAMKAYRKKLSDQRRMGRRARVFSYEWAAIRSTVFERDKFTCVYCGESPGRLQCDHVVPVSRGGTTELSNLVTACEPCNRSKGSKFLSEWQT